MPAVDQETQWPGGETTEVFVERDARPALVLRELEPPGASPRTDGIEG